MHIDPRSASELVRASAILLLRVLQAEPSAWTSDARSEVRTVALRVSIEPLKGEVLARDATVQIEQRRADAVTDSLGLWYQVPVEAGQQLVAFSTSSSHEPAEILREGPCNQLLTTEAEIADARFALECESRDLPLSELLALVFEQRHERGPVFMRWLWDRTEREALRSPRAFGQLAGLIFDSRTGEAARETLANVAYQSLQATEAPVEKQRALLVRTLLRVLALPGAAGFHQNAEGVLLRNLLHLDREPLMTADRVFHDAPAERKAALGVVQARPASVARERLLGWLRAGHGK